MDALRQFQITIKFLNPLNLNYNFWKPTAWKGETQIRFCKLQIVEEGNLKFLKTFVFLNPYCTGQGALVQRRKEQTLV